MDSAELNEIKGTQSRQFVTLIIFLEKKLMKSKAHP
jgi:hypothetical protein